MTESTCVTPECARPVSIKKHQLCQRHYDRARRTGKIEIAKGWHRITDVSADGFRGTCSVCGPNTGLAMHDGRLACHERKYSHQRGGVYARKHLYQLTPAQYRTMLEAANWRCEICNTPVEAASAHVDHDHACCESTPTCGKCTRGILCGRCNRGLGMMRDSAWILQSALTYLVRTKQALGIAF